MVTIRDVARAAGVSTATVSRVFNGSPRVSPDARKRVLAAASRLDYWPNTAARSLTTSRTHVLGVLLPDLFGEFFSEIIRGIDHAARAEKFQILVSSSHARSNELLAVARSMHGRVDGLIAMALDNGSARSVRRISQSFPLVLMNAGFGIRGCSSVSIANRDGALAMVQHLHKLGHRRIAMVCGPEGNADAEERRTGFRDALEEAGIEPEGALEIPGDFTESSGYDGAAAVLRLRPRPTAIFAANDYMAVGLLGALRHAGISIPEEMAVTGFDDIAIAQYLNPPLTTVHVDAYEQGQQAVRLLLSTIRAASTPRATHEVLPTRLVVRSSCGSSRPFAADVNPRLRRGLRLLAGDDGALPLPGRPEDGREPRPKRRTPGSPGSPGNGGRAR